jgi:hypothetical protein
VSVIASNRFDSQKHKCNDAFMLGVRQNSLFIFSRFPAARRPPPATSYFPLPTSPVTPTSPLPSLPSPPQSLKKTMRKGNLNIFTLSGIVYDLSGIVRQKKWRKFVKMAFILS